MANVTIFCFLASYLVAFVLELTRLLGRSRLSRLVMLGFGAAGLVAHTMFLLGRFRQTQLPPLLSSTHDWLLVLAWLLILFYLFLTAMDRELALGAFTLPVVLVLIAATYFMNDPRAALRGPEAYVAARRGWAMLHAAALVFGMAGVAIGFVSGVMYLVQHRRLKTRHPEQQGWKMPNLEKLAVVNRWSLMLSFLLLSIGFATGIGLGIFPRDTADRVAFTDPLVITSGILWVVLAGVFVWLLRHRKPTGRQMTWLTVCALSFLVLTLVGLWVITGGHAVHVGGRERGRGGDDQTGRLWDAGTHPFSPSPPLKISPSSPLCVSVSLCLCGESLSPNLEARA